MEEESYPEIREHIPRALSELSRRPLAFLSCGPRDLTQGVACRQLPDLLAVGLRRHSAGVEQLWRCHAGRRACARAISIPGASATNTAQADASANAEPIAHTEDTNTSTEAACTTYLLLEWLGRR